MTVPVAPIPLMALKVDGTLLPPKEDFSSLQWGCRRTIDASGLLLRDGRVSSGGLTSLESGSKHVFGVCRER